MPDVRLATAADLGFLGHHDRHVGRPELSAVVARGRVLLLVEGPERVGWLRWGLFWDAVPFMNLLHVVEAHRGRGLGRLLVETWETHCRDAGHGVVLTSTMSDEQAQHFYRHLGYVEAGALRLPGEGPELVLWKSLG